MWAGSSIGKSMHHDTTTLSRYVPDLAKDKFHVWITKYHYVPMIVLGVILLAIGGLPFVLWGIFLRTVFGLHPRGWSIRPRTVGLAPVPDARRFDQQLVGGDLLLRRRLAQQPSRASGFGAPRPRVVRIDLNWYGIWTLQKLGLAKKVYAISLPEKAHGNEPAPTAPAIPAALVGEPETDLVSA